MVPNYIQCYTRQMANFWPPEPGKYITEWRKQHCRWKDRSNYKHWRRKRAHVAKKHTRERKSVNLMKKLKCKGDFTKLGYANKSILYVRLGMHFSLNKFFPLDVCKVCIWEVDCLFVTETPFVSSQSGFPLAAANHSCQGAELRK